MAPYKPMASRRKSPADLGETIPVYLKQLPPSPQESSQVGMANIMAHCSCSSSPMLGTPREG